MEQATELQLDEKTKDLIIAYIVQYHDVSKAIEKAGVTQEEFRAWYMHNKGEEFDKRFHAFRKDSARNIIRDPQIPEPMAQWLENTKIEILPLLYNFDGLENDDELKTFIEEYNIYTGPWGSGLSNVPDANFRDFKRQLQELKTTIDKYLAGKPLSEESKVRARDAYHRRNASTGYGELDGSILKNIRWYKTAYNPGSINIQRAYGDMWEVIKGRKQLKRCADPKCDKIFVPRKVGGRKQEYHNPDCGRRLRQRLAYNRRKSKKSSLYK